MTEWIVYATDRITKQTLVFRIAAESKGEAIYRAKEMLLASGDFPDVYYFTIDRIH